MTRIESEALVVRTVEVGESDVVATLVTERAGKLSAAARGARKGSRRLGGALEPMHTVAVLLEERGGEIGTLKEARIVHARVALASNLETLEAAGVALRWARHLFPPRTPEPEGWRILIDLLDRLDALAARSAAAPTARSTPSGVLAHAGLALLSAVGYGLDLEACVRCGRPCPEGRPACVDPARGGLVCRGCGGAPAVLAAPVRDAALRLSRAASPEVDDASARAVLDVVDRAMAAHAGFER